MATFKEKNKIQYDLEGLAIDILQAARAHKRGNNKGVKRNVQQITKKLNILWKIL